MTSTISVDDALRSAAAPSRTHQFIAEVLGNKLPGVHIDEVEDEAHLSPQTFTAEGGDSSSMREGSVGEHHYAVGHVECLEYLLHKGPDFLTENLHDKEAICSVLRNMADNLNVLPPADEALPWDILDMARWKDSLCEMVKEMKTVKEKLCPSLLIGNSGLYVLTSSNYAAFLTTLAAKIADPSI